jgi:hypothetical protein
MEVHKSRTMGSVPDRGIQLGSSVDFWVLVFADFVRGAERQEGEGEAEGGREGRGGLGEGISVDVPSNGIRNSELHVSSTLAVPYLFS